MCKGDIMGLNLLNLGEIMVDGTIINLDTLSIEDLNKHREKIIEKRNEIQELIKSEVIEKE